MERSPWRQRGVRGRARLASPRGVSWRRGRGGAGVGAFRTPHATRSLRSPRRTPLAARRCRSGSPLPRSPRPPSGAPPHVAFERPSKRMQSANGTQTRMRMPRGEQRAQKRQRRARTRAEAVAVQARVHWRSHRSRGWRAGERASRGAGGRGVGWEEVGVGARRGLLPGWQRTRRARRARRLGAGARRQERARAAVRTGAAAAGGVRARSAGRGRGGGGAAAL